MIAQISERQSSNSYNIQNKILTCDQKQSLHVGLLESTKNAKNLCMNFSTAFGFKAHERPVTCKKMLKCQRHIQRQKYINLLEAFGRLRF